ncbi:hypothetical protein G9A89_004618 [Geosiphon pyriformis]|nr:hypothetical protein G9A89_004618 [Geosiphon pyriformis]
MDGSLSGLGSVNIKAGAAVFFKDISMDLGVRVSGLMSSTLTKLQTIALALECVPSSCSIDLFSNNQAALDACKLELDLLQLSLAEICPILSINAILGLMVLPFLVILGIFSGLWVVVDSLYADIDWFRSLLTAGFQTYFIKTLHFWLPVAMQKQLYDKSYSSVVCLFCGDVKVSDHAFFCPFNANVHARLLDSHLLFTCLSNILVSIALYKGFVFKNWFHEFVSVFKDSKVVSQTIVVFHHAFMEKNRLIPHNKSVLISISEHSLVLSMGMIGLLDVAEAIGVGFSFHKSFFADRIAFPFPFPFFTLVISLNTPLFIAIELANLSTGSSGSGSTGLGTWSGTKKKIKPEVAGGIVDSSAGPLPAVLLHSGNEKHKVSWRSKVENDELSISGVSDVENMTNTIAKETSYVESGDDNEINEATPRKTWTRTYMLGKSPKAPTFNSMSDDENALSLLSPKMFNGSNQMSSVKSHAMEKRSFEPVKFFILDIEVSAVPRKTNVDKLMAIKKIFYRIDGFGGASTPSKFPGIIRSTFISELSLGRAKNMAISEKIIVNNDLRRVNSCSDWEVIIKEIPVDLLKFVVEAVFSKFGKIVSIKMQLIGLWQKALVKFESSKVASLVTSKWSVFVRKDLVHVALAINNKQTWVLRDQHQTLLYTLPVGTNAHDLSSLLKSYGGKTCYIGRNPNLYVRDRCAVICFGDEASKLAAIGTVLVFKGVSLYWAGLSLASCTRCKQFSHVIVNCSLGVNSGVHEKRVVSDQDWICLAGIYKKKSALVSSGTLLSIIHDAVVEFSSSSSKVLTAKVSGLETKLIALEASVGSVLDKLNILCSGSGLSVPLGINNPAKQEDVIHWHKDMNNLISIVTETKLKGKIRPWIATRFDSVRVFTSGQDSGNLGLGVAIVVDNSLACHVCKVSKMPGQLLSIKLLFKNKLSVLILGLYAGVFLTARFSQASESSFVVLGGDFNEDGSHRCASFKKCLDLGIVNSLAGNSLAKSPTWRNSRGVVRTIDYVFISSNLVNAIVSRDVLNVCEYFNTDHQAVCVFKFNIRGADESKWDDFRSATLANTAMFSDKFATSVRFSDLDVMWDVICEVMVFSANGTFKKKWFKDFDRVFSKKSSKFYKLELLVSKIIKASCKGDVVGFASFMDCWASLDSIKALFVWDLMDFGIDSGHVLSALSSAQKSYRASKLIESAIDRRMESFEVNKDHTIRSVLERPFCKVVLNHLVVDSELVLESDQVMSKVDVVDNISSEWCHQYRPLEYVFNKTFSEVMCPIGFDELFGVVSVLLDGKAAGLLGISNELWKHCDRSVLKMLLVLLNVCLAGELAWVSMIPKPYEWEGVLTNTRSIALIKTARKILSKVLSDRISTACSTFNVLRGDNFSVLKGTTTQSPIFAIGSVIEDALEKNRKLWLVLQDMRKAYDSMCNKFIRFFGSIHKSRTNRVMIDFGLTSGYCVYDDLDQGEESVCGYRLNLYFISKNGRAETQAGLFSFFAISAFVNDTIWVDNSQAVIQHILNVTSEFFWVNDISINNDKTVAISINSRVSSPSLSISDLPISIAKKGESHQYLGIFLSTKGLSKPSLAKTHSDVRFFVNLVLRKAISDKQFLYLVLAILQSIISYRTQFSFILVGVCAKWDALVHKGLKLKSGLPLDFPSDTLHHSLFYSLKSFLQVQSECKVVSFVSFVNSDGILVNISASNNFLAGLVCILLDCNLSLGGSFVSSFWSSGSTPMFTVLGKSKFSNLALPLLINFVTVMLTTAFLNDASLLSKFVSDGAVYQDILGSADYASVCGCLSQVISGSLSVYTDGSLRSLGTAGCRAGAAAFFEDIDLDLGVGVSGLMSSTLVELQAIALAMECVPLSCSVCVFSDSQSALNACKSEIDLVCPDFCNQCWVERWHIANIIRSKNLRVSWHKVKGHSGVSGNERADEIAGIVSFSSWHLRLCLDEHFLMADGSVVLGNLRHFDDLLFDVDWFRSSMVWHPDSHMVTSSTSRPSANAHTYFMKALHHQLPVAVRKRLYNKYYTSVLCLYCGDVESSDHVFFCKTLTGLSLFSSVVMQLLSSCASDFPVFVALCKGFVFNDWFCEAVSVFRDPKIAELEVVKFMVRAKHHAYMEKAKLIPLDGSTPVSVSGLISGFSAGVVKLLGITEAVGVHFGFHKLCLFFSDVSSLVSVCISE